MLLFEKKASKKQKKLVKDPIIITIREAKESDASVMAKAEREIAEKPGFFCSDPSELTDENVLNTISTFIKNKTGMYLVAEYEEQLLGHAFLEPFHVKSLRHVA